MTRTDAIAVLLLAFFLGIGIAGEPKLAATYDEPQHLRWGRAALAGRFPRESFYDDSKMPVTALNALAYRAAERWTRDPSSRIPLHAARWVTLFFSAAIGLLLYRSTLSLFGEAGALLCLALYVLDPNIQAHSQLVTTDVFAMGGTFATLHFFQRFLEAPGTRSALKSALALGLSLLTKYTCVLLYPVLLLTLVARLLLQRFAGPGPPPGGLRARGPAWRSVLLWTAVHLVVPLVIVDAGFAFRGVGRPLGEYRFRSALFQGVQDRSALVSGLPVPVAASWLEGLDWVVGRSTRSEGAYANLYLLGHVIPTDAPFRGFTGYYLVAYLFKVPLPAQILILAALFGWLLALRRRECGPQAAFLLAPSLFFWVYFNFFQDVQIGIRHFLVVQPFMIALAGRLAWDLKQRWAGRPVRVALGVLLSWQAISVLAYHPHYIAYFNELVPDKRYAYRILADSNLDWGQSRFYVRKYLAEHPGALLDPPVPTAGRLVIGVNELTGVVFGPHRYQWLREGFRPVEQIAYTHLVYDVSDEALRRALAGQADPGTP
jgi:hypothetical protein